MFKMALYQNHVILVQWYNWYKKVQLGSVQKDFPVNCTNSEGLESVILD